MKDEAELPFMPLWARDHLLNPNIATMSLEAEAIYLRLLCHIWLYDSVPSAPDRLAQLCNTDTETINKRWDELRSYFKKTEDGQITHSRLIEIKQKKLKDRRERSKNGKKGAAVTHGYDSIEEMERLKDDGEALTPA